MTAASHRVAPGARLGGVIATMWCAVSCLAITAAVAMGSAAAAPGRTTTDDVTVDEWSPVVYPAQRMPLTFSHAKHLARGTACTACHPRAPTSRSAVDNLIPTETECRACHPIDRSQPERVVANAPPAQCRACHPGWRADVPVARVYLAPPPLKFDHAAHGVQRCESCHTDMARVDLATTRQLPTMASCLACHKDGAQTRHCADCHMARLGGLIQTSFPHGTLVPHATGLGDAHRSGFAKDHRQEAMQNDATCGACHDRSECVACHQGTVKPTDFHPGNYVLAHVVDARRGKPDCSACHRLQSFCVGCHEREGLGRRGLTDFDPTDPDRRFHPPGWASRSFGPNRHAAEAKRNIGACASCHREDECLDCHSAQPGSLKASPHPPGWRGSARCRALDRSNRRMCLKCHTMPTELGCDWQASP
jgi:cytochrome c7-like protein